jgi:hypothetical protein
VLDCSGLRLARDIVRDCAGRDTHVRMVDASNFFGSKLAKSEARLLNFQGDNCPAISGSPRDII